MAVQPNGRLDSWKAIAAYLGRDVSTVIRWEKDKGLPVHRVPGGKRQTIFALAHEIDAWLVGQPAGSETAPAGTGGPAADGAGGLPGATDGRGTRAPVAPMRWVAAAFVGAAALALVAWLNGTEAHPTAGPATPGVPAFSRHDIQIRSPYSLAAGDLDGDGRIDFVVTGYRTNMLHAFLGQGDGTFRPSGEAATGIQPDGVVLGDFNGDGVLDAATANRDSDTVSIFQGTGAGTFGRRVDHAGPAAPRGLVAADLDGNGTLDLAAAGFDAASVATYTGSDGLLRTGAAYGVGVNPYQARAADLNGDGVMDLIVGNTNEVPAGGPGAGTPATLVVFLGTGGGPLREQARYLLGHGSSGIAVADLDRDGHLDLAVTSFEDDVLFLLRGRGDGSFDDPTSVAAGEAPLDVIAVDVDADGLPDLVTTNAHAKSVSILRGRGDFTFEPKTDVGVNSYPKSIVAADVDDNGSVDFIVSNFLDNTISILLSRH